MRAVQIPTKGAGFELVDRPKTEPGPGMVRVKVAACGICHSDFMVKQGLWPNLAYPRVPGHEVAGVVDAVGPEVTGWTTGDRVGIGWHGHHCGICEACRAGDFIACVNLTITGFHFDGGYEEFMIAPADGLARIPDALTFAHAAPLLCAGVTTFNSLRHANATGAISSPSKASAASATSGSSLPTNSASASPPSLAARIKRNSRCASEPTFISILPP